MFMNEYFDFPIISSLTLLRIDTVYTSVIFFSDYVEQKLLWTYLWQYFPFFFSIAFSLYKYSF